jgi:beta-glucosidase
MSKPFPDGFLWSAATAAYQVEGVVDSDGRGPTIWDEFVRGPGAIVHGDTGDVACDQYHRLEPDLDLMAEIGLKLHRFSVAWARVVPDGLGPVNGRGFATTSTRTAGSVTASASTSGRGTSLRCARP